MPGSGIAQTGIEEVHNGDVGTHDGKNPRGCQGPGCRLRSEKGGQTDEGRRHMKARGAGHREEHYGLAEDRC